MNKLKLLFGIVFWQALVCETRKVRFHNCIYARNECPNKYITFWLYKNETRTMPTRLEVSKLQLDSFLTRKPIRILIHGFLGDRNDTPNFEIRDPLLQTQSVDVISVDYSGLVRLPCYYPWSIYNVRVVAKCLAQLLDNLIEKHGFHSSDFHIIGFSLGAQIAGLTRNFAKHKLKRITALDPAGLGFTDTDVSNKLDKSDADFIDVIHTDPFFFSTTDPMGHADFYVNFPSPIQPGCIFWRNGYYYNCNHFRSAVYYAESLMSTAEFWSRNCGSWMDFLMQNCDNYRSIPDVKMGYFVSEKANGSYFVSTNSKAPFAKGIIKQ